MFFVCFLVPRPPLRMSFDDSPRKPTTCRPQLEAAAPCEGTKYELKAHRADWFSARFHYAVTKSEAMRCIIGGGAGTLKPPEDLANWSPDNWAGGLMDRKPA